MSTYRERRLARAERLKSWADKRDEKAEGTRAAAQEHIDNTVVGQPILVGHHSEKRHRRQIDRFNRNMERTVEHTAKAKEMRLKAENIEAAAERAIYDDDIDAVSRLERKIADAEAVRAAVVAFNKSCRRGTPDTSILPADLRDKWEELRGIGRGLLREDGGFHSPGSSQIPQWKKRLARLKRERGETDNVPRH